MNKKIFSGLAALAVVFSGAGALPVGTFEGFSLTASAEETKIVAGGYCGENVNWTLDSEGTLTISGTGDLYDFYPCSPWFFSDVKNVIINDGVTSINGWNFYNFTSLKSITIPGSVTSISSCAFRNCTSLESITIPDSVMSIGYGAFYWCSSLNNITVADDNKNYCAIDGILFSKDKTQLVCCPANKRGSYIIPDSVTSIGAMAFGGCTELENITIPDSVTSIGANAFDNCTNLTSVTIPNSVTSIGIRAFYDCKSIKSITIPDSVTSIGAYAFDGCTNLTSVTIPNSVTSIGVKAFGYYYGVNLDDEKKLDNFTIKGYKGTAAETYANDNGFKFIDIGGTDGKYPRVKPVIKDRQFRLEWKPVPGAEKYGLAAYQSGKWRVKVQFPANVTSYISPKYPKPVTLKLVLCAKVNGVWDTSNLSKRAFTIVLK